MYHYKHITISSERIHDPPLKTELIMPSIRNYYPNINDHVLITCDVISSGDSLSKGCEIISSTGATPIGFAVVNRSKKAIKVLNDRGIETRILFEWDEFEESKREHEEIKLDLIENQKEKIKRMFSIEPQDYPIMHEIYKVDKNLEDFIKNNRTNWLKALNKSKVLNISEKNLKKWMKQFETVKEKDVALKLLINMNFLDEISIKKKFIEIHQRLIKEVGKDALDNYTHFISLCRPGKNNIEPLDLYGKSGEGNYNSLPTLFLDKRNMLKKENLVIVTDFLGIGGKETLAEWEKFKKYPQGLVKLGSLTSEECNQISNHIAKVNKYLVAICGFESGAAEIQNRTGIKCIIGYPLTNRNRAFSVGSVFPTENEAYEAKKLIEDISIKLHHNQPFGSENDDALVVFSFNIPKNTLGIFWRYGSSDHEWIPLFQRFNVDEDLTIAINGGDRIIRKSKNDNSIDIKKKHPFKYDVFICHSSEDKPIIETITNALAREKIAYWVDAEQIKFGDRITQKIEDGLKDSRYVMPCLSKHLAKSNWCRAEYGAILNIEFSGDSERKTIPLKLDDCTDEDIPMLLKDKRFVDYSKRTEFERFITFLKE